MKDDNKTSEFTLSCPLPISDHPNVLLAHGGGGKLTHTLVEKMFLRSFANPLLEPLHDGAVLEINGSRLAYTTDSYVVQPLFFPGGDIGSLAVHGTVNDLAMCGAKPLFISLGLIIEEGLPMDVLWRVTDSISKAARASGVHIVTGDTKVVDRGKGDGLYINTSGIGIIEKDRSITPASIRQGDVIVLSGDIGRHGMAVMGVREGLKFETPIESDSASLVGVVDRLLASQADVHCMRDLTRGGLATVLVEIAGSTELGIEVDEPAVPVRDDVRGACEILGLDPMYVANEGRFIAFVASDDAEAALEVMRGDPAGTGACVVGKVVEANPGLATLRTAVGSRIILDMLSGEQLPRIC
jgi:hydrogenase expression/formation protein HypE